MNRSATLLLVTLAISNILGTPTPSKETDDSSKFHQLLAQIKSVLPETNQVTETIYKQLELQLNNLQTILSKINDEFRKIQFDDYFRQIGDKWDELKTSLEESVGINATATVVEFKNKIGTNLQTANAEFNRILADVKPNFEKAGERMQSIAKDAWESYLNAIEGFKVEINRYLPTTLKFNRSCSINLN